MLACSRRMSPLMMMLTGLSAASATGAEPSAAGHDGWRCPDGNAVVEPRPDASFVIRCKGFHRLRKAEREPSPPSIAIGAATTIDGTLFAQTPPNERTENADRR